MQSVILLLLLGIVSCSLGQNPTSNQSKEKSCLPLISNFDKRADRTLVQTQPFILGGAFWIDENAAIRRREYQPNDWGFAIAFLYSYPGKQYSKPAEIDLEALYEGVDFRYEKKFDLWFELDNGETIHPPAAARATESLMIRRKREHLSTKIQLGDLEKIVKSKSIHLRVNEDKFDLNPCEYSSLRVFFNTIR
jgi:hypothetical protein